MSTRPDRYVIYRAVPATQTEFIKCWASQYPERDRKLDAQRYTPYINKSKDATALRELFKWKAGTRFLNRQMPGWEKHFVSRRKEAAGLPQDISGKDFLAKFPAGGPVYRIFWLHCWLPSRFPIYDQHVHRAMTFIENGVGDELGRRAEQAVIDLYLNRYMRFYCGFAGVDGRTVDRGLWVFGKYVRSPLFALA